jgi:hypothetical protein
MVMLTTYLDESRMEDAHNYPVMGGYLGTVGSWLELSVDWKRILMDAGILVFHAAEMWANQKGTVFEDSTTWNLAAKVALVEKLLTVIEDSSLIGVLCAIDNAAYLEIAGSRKDFSNKYGSQYEMCGYGCTIVVGQFAASYSPSPIAFVLDEGNRYRHQFERAYEIARRGPQSMNRYLGSLTFASDARATPLQAADLYAWTVARIAYEDMAANRDALSVPWAQRLWSGVPKLEKFIHRDLLIKIRDDAGFWERQHMPPFDAKELSRFFRKVRPASERNIAESPL